VQEDEPFFFDICLKLKREWLQKGVQINMLRGKSIFSSMSFRRSLRLANWKKHIMPIQLKYHNCTGNRCVFFSELLELE
jgi:hypothetical protein